jgi:hypothetical protein
MNFSKFKLTKKKMIVRGIILLVLVLVFVFWRRSYFMFTPNLKTLDVVELSELDENTVLNLKTYSEIRDGEYYWEDTPWLGYKDTLYFLEKKVKKGAIYGGTAFAYTSKEYGWKKKFNDYYAYFNGRMGGEVAYNDRYVVFFFERGEEWYLLKTSPGAFFQTFNHDEPSILIYLLFNTAKIGWNDLFIVDRKTGKIKEKFRVDYVFNKAYLDESNKLYIRDEKDKSLIYQIE